MLTANVENMLVTSIDRALETGVVPTQYTVIISTVRRQPDSDSRKLVSSVGLMLVRLLISAWVQGFVDADWGGCIEERKSQSGYIFLFSGGPISSD